MVVSDTTRPDGNSGSLVPGDNVLKLTTVFRPGCIEVIRAGTGKGSLISLLVRALAREERIDRQHAEIIIGEVLDRERHCSSAMGKGLAFPHLRTRDVDHFVGAIGVAPDGVQFGAIDNTPTKLVFLTLSPWEDREQHVDLLSRLVRLMEHKAVNLHLHRQIQPKHVYGYLTDIDEHSCE